MKLITLDFETFYDREYSLSKISTEEYIRDPRFEVIGLGIKDRNSEPRWYTDGDIERVLKEYDWSKCAILAHNTMFDGAILSWRYGVRPKLWLDTLSMARPVHGSEVGGSLAALSTHYGLGEKGTEVVNALGKRRKDFSKVELDKYGEYCKNDVQLTHALFHILGSKVDKKELEIIDLTLRMYTEPVLELDRELLTAHLSEVIERQEKLISLAQADRATLMSNDKFAAKLYELGVEPPTKISPTTGKPTLALAKTDEAFKALAEHPDERVQALVAARLGNKSTIEQTRTERFLDISNRGTLPIPLKYYAAHTGRWGGCLVADTQVLVYDPEIGVAEKRIIDVLPDDLVWDGEEFVPHEGVVFSGFSEVITWDGVTGTPDHVVFTDAGEVSLREAMQRGYKISPAGSPSKHHVDAAREFVGNNEIENSM